MKNLQQRIKDNWQYLFGATIGTIVVVLSLWLWAELVGLSFNVGIEQSFDLNNWFVLLSLLSLVGIAFILYRAVLIILWIIEKACKIISKDGAENAEK
jgi:hypothetical protein